MNVFSDRTYLMRASNRSPYWPGASSIPSCLAMENGSTGRRHMSSATRCFLASASRSTGGGTSTLLSFSPLALDDLSLLLLKLFGGGIVNDLGAVETGVG